MKRILFILFLCCIGSGLAACKTKDHTVPTLPSGNDPGNKRSSRRIL